MPNQYQLPWQDPAWIQQVQDWIRLETAWHSIQITDEIKQARQNSWSTVLTFPTTQGRLFFKATAPETIHEAALTQTLAEWFPDCMPELITVHAANGWMLVRDGGEPMRSTVRSTLDIQPWVPVISRYAELQIETADRVSEILALGVPDHRPEVLPPLFSQLVEDEESMMIGHEKGLTPVEYQELQKLFPRFQQICLDLSGLGIPASLNHGDLHDANVLIKDGRFTFYDWGDATITHPFVSLRTLFVSIEMSLQLEEYSFTPGMEVLLDRYLKSWEDYASMETLRMAYQLSKPVATVTKAITWHEEISRLEEPVRQEHAWIIPSLFKEFLHYMKE